MPTIAEIKEWLKKNEKDRYWLAEKCEVDKRTVDGWLSTSRGIPPKALLAIQLLMSQSEKKEELFPVRMERNDWVPHATLFSKEEYELLEQAASLMGMDVKTWAEKTLIEDAQRAMDENKAFRVPRKPSAIEEDNPFLYEIWERGNIAAGSPEPGDGQTKLHKTRKQYPANHYAVRVCGASMEPLIPDDSLVVLKPWIEPEPPKPGTIVAYWDERGITLKELRTIDGKTYFASLNPDYPDVTPMDGGHISATFVEVLN